MGGPQPRAPERSPPGARRPPVGRQGLVTPRAPRPAALRTKGASSRDPAHRARDRAGPGPAVSCPRRPPVIGGVGGEQVPTVRRPARGARESGAWAGLPEAGASGSLSLQSPEPTLGPEMTACKRVAKELEEFQKVLPRYLRNLSSDDADVLVWHALLLPEKPPYNLRAFNLRINFPEEYPMRPPTVTFTTKIYHPNVGVDGQVCLPIISNENWKPSTKTYQVLEALSVLVNNPDLGEPVRLELADLLTLDSEKFHRIAEEFTLQFGEPRPS